MKKLLAFITILVFSTGFVYAYPKATGYVNDYANVIPDKEETVLDQKLRAYDKKTTDQIVVVTVDTTQPESIEEYTVHLANEWKPGVKGKDNGIVMLFAMKDHKMRTEVGRGLEGRLTDIESHNIQDDTIVPLFKQGKYADGISKGVDAVITALASDVVPSKSSGGNLWPLLVVLGLFGGVGLVVLALSEHTPLGGEGDGRIRGVWVPKKDSKWGTRSFGTIEREHYVPIPFSSGSSRSSYSSNDDDDNDSSSSGGSSGGGITFGGGSFSGGGSSSSW